MVMGNRDDIQTHTAVNLSRHDGAHTIEVFVHSQQGWSLSNAASRPRSPSLLCVPLSPHTLL